jgi:phage head maturation protease
LRTIEKVGELFDVSVVTRGAYPTTEVGVRSLQEHRQVSRFNAAALRIRLKTCQSRRLMRPAG